MQHRRGFVQADDVRVRQVQVGVSRRRQVGGVNRQLRRAVTERVARGEMPGHRATLGGAHAVEFVRCLERPVEVQGVEHHRRVVRHEPRHGGVGLADDRGAAGGRQVPRDLVGRRDDAHVEFVHPRALRRARRHMPVIVGLEIHQHRLLPGRVGHPAVRMSKQRHPGLELRVGLERIRPVVEEFELLDAGCDEQVIETALRQRGVRARLDRFEVGAI